MITLLGDCSYRIIAGTDWPGVSILRLGESLICNFNLSVAARTLVWADPSLRYTNMLLGRLATNQQTNVPPSYKDNWSERSACSSRECFATLPPLGMRTTTASLHKKIKGPDIQIKLHTFQDSSRLFPSLLSVLETTKGCLRNGSAHTILRATALKRKLQVKLVGRPVTEHLHRVNQESYRERLHQVNHEPNRADTRMPFYPLLFLCC